jgi:hypothetical protein
MSVKRDRFTFPDATGTPVQRTVEEMTSIDVLLSVTWHHREVVRINRAAAEAAERLDRLMRLLKEHESRTVVAA